tara:strand:+ start:28151 stop:28579 length:429 start_codon:yes stop_codon:yes gene_type:complete
MDAIDKVMHNTPIEHANYKSCFISIFQMYGKYGKFYSARVKLMGTYEYLLSCTGSSLWILKQKYKRWIDLFATELNMLRDDTITVDKFKEECGNCDVNSLVTDLYEEMKNKANSREVRKESRKCDATLQAEAEAALYNSTGD